MNKKLTYENDNSCQKHKIKPTKYSTGEKLFMATLRNAHCDCKGKSRPNQPQGCYSGKVGFKNEKWQQWLKQSKPCNNSF